MSVVVIGRIPCDPQKLVDLFTTRKEVFERVSGVAKAAGAKHHRFLLGDGEVLILDEWDSASSFDAFFHGNADIPGLMQEAGVQGPPSIEIFETVDSPDIF
jgi:heme-degrading monooxygenase HmoA